MDAFDSGVIMICFYFVWFFKCDCPLYVFRLCELHAAFAKILLVCYIRPNSAVGHPSIFYVS